MSKRPKKEKREVHIIVRILTSVIALCILAFLTPYAVTFCLGMFADGAYIVDSSQLVTLQETEDPELSAIDNAEPDKLAIVAQANLLTTGDLMMHLPIVRSGLSNGSYDFSYIYDYIRDYVSAADYAIVNLETTLSGTDGKEYTGYPKFNSPDAVASGAKSAGFDMMLTGNNHCYDYGTDGLLRTLDVVKTAGLTPLGTTTSADETKYVVKNINGIKVGMICYTFAEIGEDRNRPSINDLHTDSAASGLINAFDYDQLDMFYQEMDNHISAMRASGAEAIVLFIHWGTEYSDKVSSNQTAIAQKMCDLGVDIIAGSHPHVVQNIELLTSSTDETHQTVCVYSMGNFLSNQRSSNISLTTGQSEDSVLFTFTLTKYNDGQVCVDSVDLLPTWVLIRGSGDGRTYHILPLDTQVESWTQAYDLTADQLSDAQSSYNRTIATVGIGLDTVRTALEAQKTQREADLQDTPISYG